MHAQADLKYSTFKKMNMLWLQYIMTLLQPKQADLDKGLVLNDVSLQSNFCSKLTKADFSGAHVTIVNAKNKVLIGVSGLVVRETARTLVII